MTADGDVIRGLFAEKVASRLPAFGRRGYRSGTPAPRGIFFFLCSLFSAWILNWLLPHGEYVRPERARAKRFVISHDDLVGGGLER